MIKFRFIVAFALLAAIASASWVQSQIKVRHRDVGKYPHFQITKEDSIYTRTYRVEDTLDIDTSAYVSIKPGATVFSSMTMVFTDPPAGAVDSMDTEIFFQVALDQQGWTSIDSVSLTTFGSYSLRIHRTDTMPCNMFRIITEPIIDDFTAVAGSHNVNFTGVVVVQEP